VRGNVAQRSIGGFRAAAETTRAVGDRNDVAAAHANDSNPVLTLTGSRGEDGLGNLESDFGFPGHENTIHVRRHQRENGKTRSAQIKFRLGATWSSRSGVIEVLAQSRN